MIEPKYRLVTRSDFDGLVAAILLRELELIDTITFAHPKDMQDGKVAISAQDITTNLPYVDGVHLCFDHHLSETVRVGPRDNHIIDAAAPSAARVVYNYYGGKQRFSDISDELMEAVDKADSADYTEEDILAPDRWTLLNFIMDPRTGLGRFKDFTISNYQLMMDLVIYCRHHPIEEILTLPDVVERVHLYFEHREKAERQIVRNAVLHDKTVVLDLRGEDPIFATNRFLIYALFPQASMSIHVLDGRDKKNTVLALGKSILDRSARANVGALTLRYGGGGHEAAGTCQVDTHQADRVLAELLEQIRRDG
ncbi:exopolyphosphatase [Pararhodospirillum photometricum]|uniref:Exopolyphosphatase-related proteins n=1 Tax=Pararhodospirillum photometricum DSM 122 TaxID=1150469 RepID=H6SQC8_PARPM|nr:exopolyphosphatase [Pararhodospirillum photometricum]CCG09647.1 Exopolyphosphatase-related proteins [Pararhodospirillum photometricum DSM 122]